MQTNVTIALVTALVGLAAGPAAVAGFGTAARLEYLLVPLVFGLGAPLVALVGTNIGAGQRERALRIAWTGAAIAFVLCETIGVAAALFPRAWLSLFGSDPAMIEAGSAYLRAVGPFYGCFGFGLALYFASQGAGQLLWPLLAGFARMVVAIGGGWLVLHAHRLARLDVSQRRHRACGLWCRCGARDLVGRVVSPRLTFRPHREVLQFLLACHADSPPVAARLR